MHKVEWKINKEIRYLQKTNMYIHRRYTYQWVLICFHSDTVVLLYEMYLKDSSVALHHSILTENIQQTTKPESAEEQKPSG